MQEKADNVEPTDAETRSPADDTHYPHPDEHPETHSAGELLGDSEQHVSPKLVRRLAFLAVALVASVGTGLFLASSTELTREQCYMSSIMVLAAILWITEALPLFATSLAILGLEVLLLANPGDWPGLGFDNGNDPPYSAIVGIMANPVIVLFFGGFVLAAAIAKSGLDRQLASLMVRPFGGKPLNVLAGVMICTAFLSMWMSNTAATAMMIALMIPMLAAVPAGDPFRKAMVLGVAFAANVGGMGTPIGTPPNAVALAYLSKLGTSIGFLEWMAITVPLMLGLLALTWVLLAMLFRSTTPGLRVEPTSGKLTRGGWFVLVVFIITVIGWLTGKFTGLPSAVIALIPAVALTATGLLNRDDVNSLEWNILILIAGGIALGWGLEEVGLNQAIVESLRGEQGFALMAAVLLVTVLLGNFMSHTAAANLILPIGVAIFASGGTELAEGAPASTALITTAVGIALAASIAMATPFSTPPNAIAFATREVKSINMILVGGILGVVGSVFIILGGQTIISFWHEWFTGG